MESLRQELVLLGKILDNTERQIRFFSREHRSLDGLQHLLKKRGQWLKQLEALRCARKTCGIMPQGFKGEAAEIKRQILQVRKKIQAAQVQAIQAAMQEKNKIAAKLSGNKITRNVRNAYILRWYQGASRGFSRQA